MNKVYVIIRNTPFYTEVYKVCKSMREAQECISKSVYFSSEFKIVESEFYK